jgi:hypothetical protein
MKSVRFLESAGEAGRIGNLSINQFKIQSYIMNHVLFLLIFNLLNQFAFNQKIYIREADSSETFKFKIMYKGTIASYQGSYSILKNQPVKFMMSFRNVNSAPVSTTVNPL